MPPNSRRTPVPRYALVPIGYVAGCIAAAFAIVFAIGGFDEAAAGGTTDLVLQLVTTIAVYTGALLFLPMALAVVAAEFFVWRSALIWAVIGAAFGMFALATIGRYTPGISLDRPWLFVVAGILLTLVYWVIAGRWSGQSRLRQAPPPIQPPQA